jgi:hypothetical protein
MIVTLKNLHEATEQQVFDQVVHHLLRQGIRCKKDSGCMYRLEKESGIVLRCAAGALIADDEYVIEMDESDDGTGWHDLVNREIVPSYHESLIHELQVIHDEIDPAYWDHQFQKMAVSRGLMYTWPPAKVFHPENEELCF